MAVTQAAITDIIFHNLIGLRQNCIDFLHSSCIKWFYEIKKVFNEYVKIILLL